jgi:alanine racemase
MVSTSPLTWVTVDLKAIDHNIKQFGHLFKSPTKILAIVKANAYGHGLVEIARQAIRSGAYGLGVVTAEEALELRDRGILRPIVVLGAIAKEDIKALIRHKVAMAVYSEESYRAISRMAYILNKKAIVHLKIDSGLNRLGFDTLESATRILKRLAARGRYLELEGIYSHLASTEELNQSYTNDQLRLFERVVQKPLI